MPGLQRETTYTYSDTKLNIHIATSTCVLYEQLDGDVHKAAYLNGDKVVDDGVGRSDGNANDTSDDTHAASHPNLSRYGKCTREDISFEYLKYA